MTRFVIGAALDAALQHVIDNAERLMLCAGAPTTYAEATTAPATGKAVADVAVSSGDFTLGAGATDGRKITCAAKSGVPIDADGNADHIALVDDTNDALLLVTELPDATAVADGGPTATIGSWSYTIRAAAAPA